MEEKGHTVSFSDVSVQYPTADIPSIKNVNLTVEAGEFIAIVGPSGCGKTSLLRTVNAMVPICTGDIKIDRESISGQSNYELRRNLGYVPQGGGLFPHMKIFDNLCLPLQLKKVPKSNWNPLVNTALEMVGLPVSFAERWPAELSGGQCQRVAFSRSLIHKPDCILMDEPFGALDPLIKKEVLEEFTTIRSRLEMTVIMVTHSIVEARTLADRIVIMRHGEIVQVGSPKELTVNPVNDFVRSFFDEG